MNHLLRRHSALPLASILLAFIITGKGHFALFSVLPVCIFSLSIVGALAIVCHSHQSSLVILLLYRLLLRDLSASLTH